MHLSSAWRTKRGSENQWSCCASCVCRWFCDFIGSWPVKKESEDQSSSVSYEEAKWGRLRNQQESDTTVVPKIFWSLCEATYDCWFLCPFVGNRFLTVQCWFVCVRHIGFTQDEPAVPWLSKDTQHEQECCQVQHELHKFPGTTSGT